MSSNCVPRRFKLQYLMIREKPPGVSIRISAGQAIPNISHTLRANMSRIVPVRIGRQKYLFAMPELILVQNYLTEISSTSKTRVLWGGIRGGAPRSP